MASRNAADVEREVDVFDPELMKAHNLTPEQQGRITELQNEIEAIWSKKGDYKVDDEAWRTMPLFMEKISEEDVERNEILAALQHLKYEEADPREKAEQAKEQGNKMLIMSLNPDQVNAKNFARSATRFYAEGLAVKCADRKLNAQMYGNRSMAQYLLENYGHGLEDAQKAILLDRDYTKAYYRGAKCAERIRKFALARELVDFGRRTVPPPSEQAVKEFDALIEAIKQGEEILANKEKKDRIKTRSAAADSSAIVRKMQTVGVQVGTKAEMSSEQWAQLRQNKPYFDDTGVLHVPLLLLYDEYSQTDFAQDVATDVAIGDIVEDMLPPPWDDKGRYQLVEGLVIFYKIDDGVAMPKYFRVDPDWQLFEVLRTATYVMPGLVPTFHIVPRDSPILAEIGLA